MRNPGTLLYPLGSVPKAGIVAGDCIVEGYTGRYITRVEDDLLLKGAAPLGEKVSMALMLLPALAVNIFILPTLTVNCRIFGVPTAGSHVGDYPMVFGQLPADGYANQAENESTLSDAALLGIVNNNIASWYFRGKIDTLSPLGVQPTFGRFRFPNANEMWGDVQLPSDQVYQTNEIFLDKTIGWTADSVRQVFEAYPLYSEEKHWWTTFSLVGVPAACCLLTGCPVWTNYAARYASYNEADRG